MRSARRGTRYAVLGFALVSAVVVAGMSWATVATVRLKESEILGEVRVALWRMDSYLTPILKQEAGRDPIEYEAVHIPVALTTSEGHELDPSEYEDFGQVSPLALEEPEQNWIELNFLVDHKGVWSSPQILEPGVVLADSPYSNPEASHNLLTTFQWLQNALTQTELYAVAQRALACTCPLHGLPGHENCDCQCRMRVGGEGSGVTQKAVMVNELSRRLRSQASSQLSSLPPARCLPGDSREEDLRTFSLSDEHSLEPVSIEASRAPIEALWLNAEGGEGLKLAFLRTGQVGADVYLAGFLADWNLLKPKLLAEIEDLFPDSDLWPILDDSEPDPETRFMTVNPIRAQLIVPSLVDGPRAAAWRDVRGILLSTWATALAVLVAAGWGIRNLVALTERRMQFAYAVTHELRTPLTTFRLYSDMLSAGLVPESSRQEYLDTLNRESIRLSSVVEGVLEYARVENQKVRLNPTETDASALHEVVREALEERCSRDAVEARAENEIPNGMPLRTDIDLVNRIAGVLVDNACRHVRGAERATVAVLLSGDNGRVHLDVIDSGPGVPRRDARTIFKPFRRGRGADAAAKGGIGLGLALARSWAGLMGGRLDLVARHHPEHGGAHFRLTIPARLPS